MFDVIKFHRTASGATSSAVKFDSMEDALKSYHQFASNYMADASVLAWGLAIVEVTDGAMRMIKRDNYTKPVIEPDVEEQPANEEE